MDVFFSSRKYISRKVLYNVIYSRCSLYIFECFIEVILNYFVSLNKLLFKFVKISKKIELLLYHVYVFSVLTFLSKEKNKFPP